METIKPKATGPHTSCLSAHSTGMVRPYSRGNRRWSGVEGHSRRDVRGAPKYWLRIHIVVGGGEEAMEAMELFHPGTSCSTLSITLSEP